MSALSYDAVIATRNRPDALTLSLPHLLQQSCPPRRLIVIDASDDHTSTLRAVKAATAGWAGEVITERAAPGLPQQRNRGLAHVTAPVVMFPDDDSWLMPGAAEAMMAVYERDEDGRISAVCAAEALRPQDGMLSDATYDMTAHHRHEAQWRRLRHSLERRVTLLKPAVLLGQILNARHALPDWCADMDVIAVPYMTGFRMSFRTAAIRPTGFDEALTEYAVDEDIEASFTAMRAGCVVAARQAQIYHHRCPGGRGDMFARGRMEVLNRAYVLLKHATGPLGSASLTNAIWRRHLMFTTVKLMLGLCKVGTASGRARFSGALSGHWLAVRLWHTEAQGRAYVCAASRQLPA